MKTKKSFKEGEDKGKQITDKAELNPQQIKANNNQKDSKKESDNGLQRLSASPTNQ